MKKQKLSQRQKNIILMLPSKDKEPITVTDIAKELGLSTRTVQRDLIACENWLYENDFTLSKKPGVGINLEEPDEMTEYIKELLDMISTHKQYEREDRIRFILSRLFVSDQPIKYYAFTDYLNISEKTLVQDLNEIQIWLDQFSLELVRKRGEGISINGDEYSFRKAQTSLIYESMDDNKRLEMIKDIADEVKIDLIQQNDVLAMINRETIDKVKEVLNIVFNELHMSLSDNAYVGLVVHISLALERLKLDEKTQVNQDFIDVISDSQEYIFAKKIVEKLEETFEINIPEVEISYIAMHIKGANIILSGQEKTNIDDIFESLQITKALINAMENIFQLDLHEDERLEHDLKAHITPALNRLKMNLNIRNPILDDIRDKYTEIYDILEKISPKIIMQNSVLDESTKIPEDEIGYIAIHFITAIEKRIIDQAMINIITVCPTGFGTSKLLSTKLNQRFSNFNIVENVSILQLTKAYLDENNIDLVISTVDISKYFEHDSIFGVAYINVAALPSEDDYMKIRDLVRNLSRDKLYASALKRVDSNITDFAPKPAKHIKNSLDEDKKLVYQDSMESLKNAFHLSLDLGKIYENIKFFQSDESEDLEALAASKVADDTIEEAVIEEALKRRNRIGGTYFSELNLHLMHANADIKKSVLGFGYLKDKEQMMVIMIVSKSAPSHVVELFSRISMSLIENPQLLNAIRVLDRENILSIILTDILSLISTQCNK